MKVIGYTQEFVPLVGGWAVDLRPTRYTWAAVGGPEEASIEVRGEEAAIWELADRLRWPLEIHNSLGSPVWWGYLGAVTVIKGIIALTLDLQEMSNAVRVLYRPVLPGPEFLEQPIFTAWTIDAGSQEAFGVKELILDLGEGTAAQAMKLRDATLSLRRLPQARAAMEVEAGRPCRGFLTGRGWWSTIGWRYYTQSLGLEQNAASPTGYQNIGRAGMTTILQYITNRQASPWKVDRAFLRVRKVGAPTDGLVVVLYDEAGALLASGTIPASAMGQGQVWSQVVFNTKFEIQAGQVINLRAGRTGALDEINYYRVDVDENLNYGPGTFLYYDGARWLSRVPDANLIFKLAGTEDTALQMRRLLESACGGQFLTGYDLPESSGVRLPLWRMGDLTCAAELKSLLELGSSANRRYLATISPERRLTLSESPAPGEADFLALSGGRILDPFGAELPPGMLPAGAWLRMADIRSDTQGITLIGDLGRVWVERAGYDVAAAQVRLF